MTLAGRAAVSPATADATRSGEGARATGSAGRVNFIDIGRGVGALLVVYTHFDMLFLRTNHGQGTWLTDAVDTMIAAPIGLGQHGIGTIAVPFFFLVSGFVVTPIALRLGSGRFGVNRLFRVYPLLIFAVAVSVVAFALGLRPLTSGRVPDITPGDVLTNVAMVNFVQKPLGAFVGVAWTLLVEVMFYLLIIVLLPVFRRAMWLAIALELELVVIVLSTHSQFGASYRALAVNIAYVIMPILGQVVWAAWSRRIPVWLAGGYLAIGWGLFVWASLSHIDPDYEPRTLPLTAAFVLFLLGLFAEDRLRQRAIWTALSERSYSIYLLHGAVGFPVMGLVYDLVPVWLTLLIGAVSTAVAVEVSYRLVERPSHRLGRRLSRRGTGRTETEASGVPTPSKTASSGADKESGSERTELVPRAAPWQAPVTWHVASEWDSASGVLAVHPQASQRRRTNGAPRHARADDTES